MADGRAPMRRGTAQWIQAAAAIATALAPGIWVSAALAVIGVTLLRIGSPPGPATTIAGSVQLLVLLLSNFGLYRAAAGVDLVLTPGAAMLRYAAMLAATILILLVPLAIARAIVPPTARIADIWLWSFVATTIGNLVLLPLAPWAAALAINDRTLGLDGGWRRLRPHFTGFAGAYLAIVSPFFAIHLMLTMVLDDPGSTLAGPALIAVVAADSAASLAQLVLTVALGTAAWRLRAGPLGR